MAVERIDTPEPKGEKTYGKGHENEPKNEREAKDMASKEITASNQGAERDALELKAGDQDPIVQLEVAKNPYTLPATLQHLATLANFSREEWGLVREAVAKNPNTPPDALARLSRDWIGDIREAVAKNPNTPPDALARLSEDGSGNIREAVARNHNTPPDILSRLAGDKSESVRVEVDQNPNTPPYPPSYM